MSTKRKPTIRRIFRCEYAIDFTAFSLIDILGWNRNALNSRGIYINYTDTSKSNIVVSGNVIAGTDNAIDYIAKGGKYTQQMMNIIVNRILENVHSQLPFNNMDEMVEFKKTKTYSHIRSDIRTMIRDFINCRREMLMRNIFFERVKFTNTADRLIQLKTFGKSFGYFVVSKDGTLYTNSIKDMILVKSDPRNGYINIVERTYKCIRDNHEDFKFIKTDPNAQLNRELTEDIIPYV